LGAKDLHFLGDALDECGECGDGTFGGAAIADHDEDTGFSFAGDGEFGEMQESGGIVVSAGALEGMDSAVTGISCIKEGGIVEAKEASVDSFDGYGGFGDEASEGFGFFEVVAVHGT
jgi:hypothetical protein